ncbi:hypothetical protein M413DRAFT_22620 [Hebeloma cylindrosporum]|uniref:Uncharacterized protein n=1 Tax=Hebeloma cylindrosporum TaxID=76867 RepID=A0A0C3CW49_HEBCY|nr:hypothetical protein M413DRAFT_22620 [Hebeloma cylindrosporum h7]
MGAPQSSPSYNGSEPGRGKILAGVEESFLFATTSANSAFPPEQPAPVEKVVDVRFSALHARQTVNMFVLLRFGNSGRISPSGEGFVRRMRDYESSRSRHHAYQQAKEAEKPEPMYLGDPS